MNVAVIFAGGTGQRMNTKTRPKQFLELHGKPILTYTLEQPTTPLPCHQTLQQKYIATKEDRLQTPMLYGSRQYLD